MRRRLRSSTNVVVDVSTEPSAHALRFRNRAAVLAYLDPFRGVPDNLVSLREILYIPTEFLTRLPDGPVLLEIASRVEGGHLWIVPVRAAPASALPGVEEEHRPAAPASRRRLRARARLVDVAGLFQPGYNDAVDEIDGTIDGRARRSGYRRGYTSGDDRGRIFINHVAKTDRAQTWESLWRRDTQFIELTVEVVTDPEGSDLPGDLQVTWEWEDPDDPFNDRPGVRRDAAEYLDRERRGNDNRGQCDHPNPAPLNSLDERPPQVQEIAPYALRAGRARRCETAVVNGVSRVRFHGTNVGGDNFRVRVSISPHAELEVTGSDATGLMTMWKRIDVEYRKMAEARDLPVDRISESFEAAFVQVDFTPPLTLPSRQYFSADSRFLTTDSMTYVQAPGSTPNTGGMFEHAGRPGWFFLAAVREAFDYHGDPAAPATLYSGPATIEEVTSGDPRNNYERLVVPARIQGVISELFLRDGRGTGVAKFSSAGSSVDPAGRTVISLLPADYQHTFRPRDGQTGTFGQFATAYEWSDQHFLSHTLRFPGPSWIPGGYGFPSTVRLEVPSIHAFVRSYGLSMGVSPEVIHNGNRYFAGRTILFTRDAYFQTAAGTTEDLLAMVCIHELTHAFGLPHRCGYHTYEDPATRSCAMNYPFQWLYTPGTQTLEPYRVGQVGLALCAQHLVGVRRVHLEDNPALWTWP